MVNRCDQRSLGHMRQHGTTAIPAVRKVRAMNVARGTGTNRTVMDAEAEKQPATEGQHEGNRAPGMFSISIKGTNKHKGFRSD